MRVRVSGIARFFVGVFVLTSFPGLFFLCGWHVQQGRERRAANERVVGSVLKGLARAEASYRGHDLDGNGVQDYWTGDVAGLYAHGLIDEATAMADLSPLVPLCPKPVPKDGYYFEALVCDASIEPPEPYRPSADASGRAVHHRSKFGFIAIPAEPGVSGTAVVIINEGNSLWAWRHGWAGQRYWPSDGELRQACSRFG